MTKSNIITKLKSEYPNLTKQIDGKVIALDAKEYEATISEWADAVIAKEVLAAEAKTKALAKSALLAKLGITEDEARLLLG